MLIKILSFMASENHLWRATLLGLSIAMFFLSTQTKKESFNNSLDKTLTVLKIYIIIIIVLSLGSLLLLSQLHKVF